MSGTQVMLLRSTDVGAPTLNGTAGSLVALLDACLQDGYNSKSIQSISRSGSTATATYATAHNYAADGLTKVQHAGMDQAEYNGIFQIFNITTLSYDFTVTGTPATPATGTGTAKVAPLGWSKAFAGTNRGAYRSNEVTGTRLYLRVDDNNPTADTYKTARVRGFEVMTDVDTGTGLFPTDAQINGGLWFNKSATSDSASRAWVLVGDGYEFHLFYVPNVGYGNIYRQFHFGDPTSEMASDPYGCLIVGDTGNYPNSSPESGSTAHLVATGLLLSGQSGHYFARSYTQIGSSTPASKRGNSDLGSTYFGGSGAFITYPSQANNGIYVSPIVVCDTVTIRAALNGILQPLQVRPLGNGAILLENQSPIAKRLYAISTAYSNAASGETHINIDGPWR